MHRVFLTFDVEDFINPNAIFALQRILELLEKYNIRAIFFITGHMAEKISNYSEIIERLKYHEIGYHSSSHSVHPTIPEYTDVKSYKKAYEESIRRETSHINPLTGKIERDGGIHFLQDLFYSKKIRAFRAPGMCWTPPHLEALKSLGIEHDFSTNLTCSELVSYKGLTFYPYTVTQQWNGTIYDYECLLFSILRNKITILDLHPTLFVNRIEWDFIYRKGNPKKLMNVPKRPKKEIQELFNSFELLIKRIDFLRKIKLIKTDPSFSASNKKLSIRKKQVNKCYEKSMQWAIGCFNYHPKFIKSHFDYFFQEAMVTLQ
ncbi:polysaccharide deacetylase family protein [Candidatus Bathyarchaeota archaeon]|nr:polysaccharide deacetylase family protein [Candidatus Bathyarchaeota archaeon]